MKSLLSITLLAFIILFSSCTNDDEPEVQMQEEVIPPAVATVSSMSPLSGPKTTVVTFTGTNFGSDASLVQVLFDDIEAPVQNMTDTTIQTSVPPRAFLGQVTLIINGETFTDFTFDYEIVDIMVSTFAGSGEAGLVDGNGVAAQFSLPYDMDVDTSGNIYVTDFDNHTIRKVTPQGVVSTFAGNGEPGSTDGSGANAQFSGPTGIAIDQTGNVYVSELGAPRIRKITPQGVVSTFAGGTQVGDQDGTGVNAQFFSPVDLTVDNDGNLYVADQGSHKIRKITPQAVVTTIAGTTEGFADGPVNSAQFSEPSGITVDADGTLYVAEFGNDRVRKITPEGIVSTIAGSDQGFSDGPADVALFSGPFDVALDPLGNLYIADVFNSKIRKLNTSGQVSTVAGSNAGYADGLGSDALFNIPSSIFIDDDFNLFVTDLGNHRIRKITQE